MSVQIRAYTKQESWLESKETVETGILGDNHQL